MIDELNKKPKKVNEEILWLRFSSVLSVLSEETRVDFLDRSNEETLRCNGVDKIIDEDIERRKKELEKKPRTTRGVRNRRGATLTRQA